MACKGFSKELSPGSIAILNRDLIAEIYTDNTCFALA